MGDTHLDVPSSGFPGASSAKVAPLPCPLLSEMQIQPLVAKDTCFTWCLLPLAIKTPKFPEHDSEELFKKNLSEPHISGFFWGQGGGQ